MTRQERTALGVVAALLAMGVVAKALPGEAPPVEWSAAAAAGEGSGLVARAEEAADREERASRPLADGERIDPNTAPAEELDRLPRVGPGLAARIVRRRQAHGPFRTLADPDSVPGVGPALLAQVAPHVTLAPAPAAGARSADPAPRREAAPAARSGPLDLNSATAAELEALPGIGPAIAARIVEHRERTGRFRSPEELERVPGIGPKTVQRLLPLVRATP